MSAICRLAAVAIAVGAIFSFHAARSKRQSPALQEAAASSPGQALLHGAQPLSAAVEPPAMVPEKGKESSAEFSNRLRALILAGETPESKKEIERLVAALSPANLLEVVEMFNNLPRDGRQHELAFTRLMQRWAALDGEGALAFGMSAANDPELREEFYFAAGPALEVWAAHNLHAASQAVTALAPDLTEMDRRRFSIYLTEAFGRQAPGAAMGWVEDLGTRPEAAAFAAECMLALSRSLVAKGEVETLHSWLHAQATKNWSADAIGWTAAYTALENPAEAWRWLRGLPSETMGQHGVRRMMIEWAAMNPETAGFWSEGFKEGRSFDSMVEEYATIIHTAAPHAALHWSVLIEDPRRRHALFATVMRHWEQADSEAARRWSESISN